MSDPRFPPELEQEIFIYAIQSRIQDAPNLLLVAKRVRTWLLPIVFKVIIVYHYRFFPVRFDSLSQFREFGIHIRYLLLSAAFQAHQPSSQQRSILKESLDQSPNITNIVVLWFQAPIRLESLTKLSKLTHLAISIDHLVQLIRDVDPSRNRAEGTTLTRPTTSTTVGPALFPNITHLDTLGGHGPTRYWDKHITILAYHFPGLTHIAHVQSASTTLLGLTLEKFEHLRVLVWWKSGGVELKVEEDNALSVRDERIVMIETVWERDWEREARGIGMGMWTLADMVLEERRKAKAG
ncbi:hypothetical protein BDN72DRAFT_880749 [Pluteus cervinus]|uniref:Uncharacterized protein n=1 Tax=Pluteus cervinus TaxID=181527 RepID=A0ACD3AIM0_9AGAR|nr:hypothetical protein BDN72DRAFT_880749 [Pluteus cervinus]